MLNGRSYVGSDSPGAAASALGLSYPIPPHGVGRNGMCMCVCMCMCVYMCVYMYGASLPGPERCRGASAGSQGPRLCGGTCMSRSWVAKLEHVRPRGRRCALPNLFPGEEIRLVRVLVVRRAVLVVVRVVDRVLQPLLRGAFSNWGASGSFRQPPLW